MCWYCPTVSAAKGVPHEKASFVKQGNSFEGQRGDGLELELLMQWKSHEGPLAYRLLYYFLSSDHVMLQGKLQAFFFFLIRELRIRILLEGNLDIFFHPCFLVGLT